MMRFLYVSLLDHRDCGVFRWKDTTSHAPWLLDLGEEAINGFGSR